MTETFEEFKLRIRESEKKPLPEGVHIWCTCGEIQERTILTDEQIIDMWRILEEIDGTRLSV